MHRCLLLVAIGVLAPMIAWADCRSGIADAMRRADALPRSAGRAALLEQIQRADVAHHEGDEDDCKDQLQQADDVLNKIAAAHAR